MQLDVDDSYWLKSGERQIASAGFTKNDFNGIFMSVYYRAKKVLVSSNGIV
jgi:hypothetical protein